MDLEQLATLVAVAETGGLTAAARRRHLSQPAVSLQMQALERELGTALLVRRPRGVALTRAGEALVAHARRALATVASARSEVAGIRGLQGGSLRLGATDAAATEILPVAFAGFHRRYPGVEVAVEIESTQALLAGLRSGRHDLVLGTLPVGADDLLSRPLRVERLGLVLPAGSRRRGGLAETLARFPFIAYPRASTTRGLVDRALSRAGLRVRTVMEIGQPTVMGHLVAAGIGVSVLPGPVSAPLAREGALERVSFRRFQVERALGLVRLRAPEPEPAAQAFIRLLERAAPRRYHHRSHPPERSPA
jgi:DNA-binding transcriptional LysR family regulator